MLSKAQWIKNVFRARKNCRLTKKRLFSIIRKNVFYYVCAVLVWLKSIYFLLEQALITFLKVIRIQIYFLPHSSLEQKLFIQGKNSLDQMADDILSERRADQDSNATEYDDLILDQTQVNTFCMI